MNIPGTPEIREHLASAWDLLSDDEVSAFILWCDDYQGKPYVGESDDDAELIAKFRDSYKGTWESGAAYAEELYSDIGAEGLYARDPAEPYAEPKPVTWQALTQRLPFECIDWARVWDRMLMEGYGESQVAPHLFVIYDATV